MFEHHRENRDRTFNFPTGGGEKHQSRDRQRLDPSTDQSYQSRIRYIVMTATTDKYSPLASIGSTPLVRLKRVVPEGCADVFVKLEYFSPTGSYKDRMAMSVLERAEERGDLRPGMKVLEWTGGSTGIALAFACAVRGYPFHVVSADIVAAEKLRSMKIFGAELDLVISPDGRFGGQLVTMMIERAKAIKASAPDTYYFVNQMENPDMPKGYESLGKELLEQVPGKIDAFCGCTGTSGMVVGTGRSLLAADPLVRIIAFEPATCAVLSGGTNGPHGVEGVAPGFVPPQFDRSIVKEARPVDEAEGRLMCSRLAKEEGLFAGTSTGLNVVGAITLAKDLGPGHIVVTVACDTGLKYLTGDLYQK